MAFQAKTMPTTRYEEADEYLKRHRVMELFNNITAQLMYARPGNPKVFMIETLERLQKAKATHFDLPCLFDESNINSVFGMLDPTGRGYISLKQYEEALITLGISDFKMTPEGYDIDKIKKITFLKEAKEGLIRASETYYQND